MVKKGDRKFETKYSMGTAGMESIILGGTLRRESVAVRTMMEIIRKAINLLGQNSGQLSRKIQMPGTCENIFSSLNRNPGAK